MERASETRGKGSASARPADERREGGCGKKARLTGTKNRLVEGRTHIPAAHDAAGGTIPEELRLTEHGGQTERARWFGLEVREVEEQAHGLGDLLFGDFDDVEKRPIEDRPSATAETKVAGTVGDGFGRGLLRDDRSFFERPPIGATTLSKFRCKDAISLPRRAMPWIAKGSAPIGGGALASGIVVGLRDSGNRSFVVGAQASSG